MRRLAWRRRALESRGTDLCFLCALSVCGWGGRFHKMADTSQNSVGNMEEPPYKKNLERLAALQDRLSKVQKTAESLLATVSGSGGDYTDKLVYTDVTRVSKYLEGKPVMMELGPSVGQRGCVLARRFACLPCP